MWAVHKIGVNGETSVLGLCGKLGVAYIKKKNAIQITIIDIQIHNIYFIKSKWKYVQNTL